MKDFALDFAARGFAVFPLHSPIGDGSGVLRCSCGRADCKSPGKHPRTPNGLKDASCDLAVIAAWWDRWPDANIGIATGEVSGFVVTDEDGPDGTASWAELTAREGDVATHTTRTGRADGGLHRWWKHPGITIKNRTGILLGVDVRGDGGYIVAPPSLHMSGKRYEVVDGSPVAHMPAFLLNLLLDDGPKSQDVIDPAALPTELVRTPAASTAYIDAAVRGEIDRVAGAREGTRNDTLNRAAFSLGQLVGGGLLNESDAVRGLEDAARRAGLDDGEIQKTIASGMNAGKSNPRTLPAPRALPGMTSPPPLPLPGESQDVDDAGTQAYLFGAPMTDAGNAECFVHLYGGIARYMRGKGDKKGVWMFFNGSTWAEDKDGRAFRLMVATMRHRRDAANRAANAAQDDSARNQAKERLNFAVKSENTRPVLQALQSAESHEAISRSVNDFDTNDDILIAGDTKIVLPDVRIMRPDPADMVTMALGAAYDENAPPPVRWLQFLEETHPGNPDAAAYLKRVAGYALSGDTREQVMWLFVGGGRNGKSLFLNVLRTLAGDYGATTTFNVFDADRRSDSTNDLAALRGKRLVTISETDEDRRLAEARVKAVTGGDPITCRFLFNEYFTYRPKWKLFMAMNHLPTVTGGDDGIWSRIQVVRWGVSFLGREDRTLEGQLLRELPGILNWALQGFREWHEGGLRPPQGVRKETLQYRKDSDILGQWIAERCEVDDTHVGYTNLLHESYKDWAMAQGILKPWAQNTLTRRLGDRGFRRGEDSHGRYVAGIRRKAGPMSVNVD